MTLVMRIPYSFASARASLSWRDVRFGLVHELLDPQAPIDKAVDEVLRQQEPCQDLLDLAGARRCDRSIDAVERLAEAESAVSEGATWTKYLYLALAWLYHNRNEIRDPLKCLEEVYSDFDYPDEIAYCMEYMHNSEWLGPREAYEARTMDRWKRYLDHAETIYGGRGAE